MTEEQNFARLEDLLTRNLEVTEETNTLMRQMHRNTWIAFWFKFVLWITVLALPFLLIKPILQSIFPVANTSSGVNLSTFPSQQDIQKALEAYKESQKQGNL